MAGIFISCRRQRQQTPRAVDFSGTSRARRGYDVFLDVSTIDSGAFNQIILFLKQPVYDAPVTPTPAAERHEVERRIEQAKGAAG